ncbi:MAG: hypothetical protein AAGG53_07780 [Cyanobacteria bacterium P01_H01_bin.152]
MLLETDSAKVTANELNSDRAADRWAQGDIVTQFDATEYQPDQQHDVVIANPPFGAMRDEQGQCRRFALPDNRRGTKQIDQAMGLPRAQGDRSQVATLALWHSSDIRPVGKGSDQTNCVERFNCTLRQQVLSTKLKTLSF